MQSSIFNKTGNAIVSNTGLPPSKLNLTGKFSSLEDSVRLIESEAHALTQAARVSLKTFRSLIAFSSRCVKLSRKRNSVNVA
jgi:hypothetical protein